MKSYSNEIPSKEVLDKTFEEASSANEVLTQLRTEHDHTQEMLNKNNVMLIILIIITLINMGVNITMISHFMLDLFK